MAKTTKPEDLGKALEQELTVYHKGVVELLDKAGNKAVKKLVKLTRATAPQGARGSFRRSISGKVLFKNERGSTHVWYVKAPDHRLTHLLVHGHATKNGDRTKGSPFLENALKTVLPEYEKDVQEAVKSK